MEDAVRPSESAFKAMYERGYGTWYSLYQMTIAEARMCSPWQDCSLQLENVFSNYPFFPKHLALNKSFSNTVVARGISTWGIVAPSCDLPTFEQEFFFQVAVNCPVVMHISDRQNPAFDFSQFSGKGDDHITILILAWTYILSARWAEILPGTSGPDYSNHEAEWDDRISTSPEKASVELGNSDDGAARWWAAVLAIDGGWKATISSNTGHILYSPWTTKLHCEKPLILSRYTNPRRPRGQHPPPSFSQAIKYLSTYCNFHQVQDQSNTALAAALMLPLARFNNRIVQLRSPQVRRRARCDGDQKYTAPPLTDNIEQLDRLLTLSCHIIGMKALLTSVFVEPGVECNICGAWLQGTFAFLESDDMKDQSALLRILIKRDPGLGFLWLGAFITGAQTVALREGRGGWWKLDLHVSAWTGTLISFIQEPTSHVSLATKEISRADECRLLYLSHDQSYTTPPLFPFEPFGSTAIEDTNIDVRQHVRCKMSHTLEFKSLTWRCHGTEPLKIIVPPIPSRTKNGQLGSTNISIPYDDLDSEDDEISAMVTNNIFTWLRDEDGFPVAEKAIREHEWIDNLDSDDDSPITGDSHSTAGGNLHGWLLKTITKRSNSI